MIEELRVALSRHPVASHAVGECAGALLEADDAGLERAVELVAPSWDLLWVVVSEPFAGATEDIAAAFGRLIGPRVCVAMVAPAVGAGHDLPVPGPAVGVLALRGAEVSPLRLDPPGAASLEDLAGSTAEGSLVLLGGVSPPGLVARRSPYAVESRTLAAGFVGVGAAAPLVLDGTAFCDGLVGVTLGSGTAAEAMVVDGVRPLGPVLVAGGCGAGRLGTLDARSAAEVLAEQLVGSGEELGHLELAALRRVEDGSLVDLGRPEGAGVAVRGPLHDGDRVQLVVRSDASRAEALGFACSRMARRGALGVLALLDVGGAPRDERSTPGGFEEAVPVLWVSCRSTAALPGAASPVSGTGVMVGFGAAR